MNCGRYYGKIHKFLVSDKKSYIVIRLEKAILIEYTFHTAQKSSKNLLLSIVCNQQVDKHFRLQNDTCLYSEMIEEIENLSKYIRETMPKSFNWSYIDELARYI